jgi:hypothetical protein
VAGLGAVRSVLPAEDVEAPGLGLGNFGHVLLQVIHRHIAVLLEADAVSAPLVNRTPPDVAGEAFGVPPLQHQTFGADSR